MSKDVFLAVGAGATAALFWLALGSTMPGALILVQIPLFAIGLGWGMTAVLIAAATAYVIVLSATAAGVSGMFALIAILPALMLIYLALQSRTEPDGSAEWYPTGFLLSWLSALALGYLLAAGLYFSGPEGGLQGTSATFLKARLGAVFVNLPAQRLDELVDVVTRLFPATALGLWQMTVVVAGALAQGLVSRFGRNIRQATPFSAFMLPQWISFVLVACLIASLTTGQIGYLGQNGAILVAIPFFFLGLSVIHAVSRGWRNRRFILPLVYLLMLFLGWPTLIVAGLGFVEQWLGLRRRYAAPGGGQEDE
jgi:predicted membrane protein DUF2232